MPYRVNHLYVDMNSYFASVEQQQDPSLIGRPVGIVTVNRKGACCIAASYEAKRCGIGVGTREAEARALCPEIVFREARHDLYVDFHHRLHAAVERIHPVDGIHSVDEFSCRLTGQSRTLNEAMKLAEAIRASIIHHIGPALRCSIGLGSSRLLAKMAGEMHKPAGLNWLVPEVMPGKLKGFALRDLPGIGKRMEIRLIDAGIRDIATLYAMEPKHARRLWNSVDGERFLLALRGHDIPERQTKPHSLGHSQILSGRNRYPDGARLVARRLLIKAATRLRRSGFFADDLNVSVSCDKRGRIGASISFAATQDSFTLLERFAGIWPHIGALRPASVSVMLSGLTDADHHTADLFEQRPASGETTPRERLCAEVDALNQKFGQDTIIFGERPKEITPFTGAKIAFGRIPGVEEFRD